MRIRFGIERGALVRGMALAILTISAQGANIIVGNSSFESQPTQFVEPRIDLWQKAAQPATFDTNIFGAWDNLAGLFANPPASDASHLENAEGNQLAYLFAYPQMGIYQDYLSTDWSSNAPLHALNARFEPGKSYRLTAGLTTSSQQPLTPGSTLRLSLYYRDAASNLVTVASTNVAYSTNVFANLTHLIDFSLTVPTVQPTDAWAGQHIGIAIESTVTPDLIGGVWDVDNVRLTEELTVPNFSFELPPTQFVDPRIEAWQKAAQPTTFDTNIFGLWDNLAGVFANPAAGDASRIVNAEGNQLAYLFAYPQMALVQDETVVFQPGKAYQLTVGLTTSSQQPLTPGSTLLLSLFYRDASSNLVAVASTNVTYDPNVFADITSLHDFSVNVPIVRESDAWAGKNLGIQIFATTAPEKIGGVWDVDNVRLIELPQTENAARLENPAHADGQFTFTLVSAPGAQFAIEATRNLVQGATQWTSLGVVTNTTGSSVFTNNTSGLPSQFYRARQIP